MSSDTDIQPGSLEAITKGCTCPQEPDLAPGVEPIRDWDCPLHGLPATQRAFRWSVEHGRSVEETADFLCRTPSEIRARMEEIMRQ